MRLNNLKIYCQTEEDQSEMFDFLFMISEWHQILYLGFRRRPWVMGNVHWWFPPELFDKVVEFLESENSWILEEEVEMSLDDDENNVYREYPETPLWSSQRLYDTPCVFML